MKAIRWFGYGALVCMIPAALAACGDDTTGTGGSGGSDTTSAGTTAAGTTAAGTTAAGTSSSTGTGGGGLTVDAQTPPQGGMTEMKAWLAKGDYKKWKCEAAEHAQKVPSPHGFNRICSNGKLAGAGATGNFPAGAAGVKELWDKAGGAVIGYAVYVKTQADSAGGANWYWYEDAPSLNPPGGVIADGFGTAGVPKDVCVSCHIKAGSSFAPTARDFVFTQIP
jgi:hypothetical protein